MITPAIHLSNLGKTFGKRKTKVEAVKRINLTVESGQVFGFLGPNGAGKSSTIRMIMNLIRPSTGEISILGQNIRVDPTVLKRVGALVEGALFYDFLTGRKNLELLAQLSNCQDPSIVDSLLEQMDLTNRADRLVKGYSTGMKQRLGIAATLLHDPELIILDEPSNGLDPAGIQDIRQFIRHLVDEMGKTVFLSSHLLSEVEQVCDRVAIIVNGEIVREGKVDTLLSAQDSIKIEANPSQLATAVLQPNWSVTQNGKWLDISATHEDTPHIVKQLVSHDISIHQVVAQQQSLEEYFLSVTNENKDQE